MRRVLNIAGWLVLLLLVAAVLPLTVPKLFGYELYDVLTGSMEPAIPENSVIYVKACDPAALQVGDVITFRLGSGTDLVETHRVAAVDAQTRTVTTRGDANSANDQGQVKFENVIGKVHFHIPYLGLLSDWIHSEQGIAVCLTAFAAVLLMWLVADRLKPKGKTV